MAEQPSKQLSRYRKRRIYAIAKLGGKCVVCGTTENLEIDHIIKATKSFQITQKWSVPMEIYDAELAKCQLLCHKHHVEKSHREKDWGKGYGPTEHGSLAMYKNHGCRCSLCKKKYNYHTRWYRLQQKIDAILEEDE